MLVSAEVRQSSYVTVGWLVASQLSGLVGDRMRLAQHGILDD